jgi:FlaG/FlaF family flagellin (archaellin)
MLSRKTRFRRSSKGVSTVIGTIFLVLIALTVATNVFLWTLTQNATYNQAVKESSQMDADLSSERIVAYDTVYSVSTGKVEVTARMTAQGPLSAQIITVWVTWTFGNDIKYGSETVNINLTAGDTIPLNRTVTVPGAHDISGDTCNGWLVTARGNLVPLELKKVEEITIADVSLGIGAISMNFSNFEYYNVTENAGLYVLDNYTNGGGEGYSVIEGGDGIAFQVCLTNFDIKKRDIILYSPSVLWMLFPHTAEQPRGAMWYIVNVNASGFIADDFTNITINYGDSIDLFFASENDLNDVTKPGFTPSSSLKWSPGLASVNLALFGKIGTQSYGQNIPFVSIYVHN